MDPPNLQKDLFNRFRGFVEMFVLVDLGAFLGLGRRKAGRVRRCSIPMPASLGSGSTGQRRQCAWNSQPKKNWAPRGIGAMRGGDACSVKATKGTLEREMKNPNASRVDAMWAHPTWRPKRPDIA